MNPSGKMYHGSTAVDTTAVQISSNNWPLTFGVLVKAAADNTGKVYIGNSNVTAGTAADTDGEELSAGDAVFIEIDAVSKVYAIGSAAGQKVFWIAV